MRVRITLMMIFLWSANFLAQTVPCGSIINDTFDVTGNLPSEWTEYNTSGRVTIDAGNLKFDHNTLKPSAYRTFTPVTSNFSYAFDVSSTRNYVNCNMSLISSTGTYIASFAFGSSGSKNILFASNINAGVPTAYKGTLIPGNYASNKVYSISMDVDFTNQQVDIYNEGILMAENIPFLETAQDVSKIDIQLQYMYSNEGRFFFDNISLVSTSQNRLDFTKSVTASEIVLNNATIGEAYNQYPQSAYNAFASAINNAKTFLTNCDATTSEIDQAYSDFKLAKTTFDSTRVNNPVLKLYSGYDFSGEEHEVYCGYYNGGLGAYEDWAVSFTLEKGYMATFAQDVNGLGASKVYIAQDHDLQINLPSNLQQSISFIRVSPWFPVGKKGALGNVKWTTPEAYNTTWYYDWGLGETNETSEAEFVPMAWSRGNNWTSVEKMEALGKNMSLNHIMAFNEPDNSGQSNLTVEQALEAYPKLLASGLRIGAPGVENIQYSSAKDSFNEDAWIQQFMDSCIARGYRVDFIPAHDYIRRSKASFIERFQGLHNRYNLPIWVTEFNYGNPNMGSANLTVEQGYSNIKGLIEVLEEADFIERYNWYYFFGANSGIGGMTNGELNITGQFYRDFESPAPSYTQEVYEQGSLGINDFDKKLNDIWLSPNPVTTNMLTVNYLETSASKNIVVNIFNSAGQVLITKNGLVNQIDVSGLSNGLYVIQIIDGNVSVTKKIIISK